MGWLVGRNSVQMRHISKGPENYLTSSKQRQQKWQQLWMSRRHFPSRACHVKIIPLYSHPAFMNPPVWMYECLFTYRLLQETTPILSWRYTGYFTCINLQAQWLPCRRSGDAWGSRMHHAVLLEEDSFLYPSFFSCTLFTVWYVEARGGIQVPACVLPWPERQHSKTTFCIKN